VEVNIHVHFLSYNPEVEKEGPGRVDPLGIGHLVSKKVKKIEMRGIFRRLITIRTNILTNFIIVVALVAAGLLFLQYHFSKRLALEATRGTFHQIARKVAVHMEDNDHFIRTFLYQMALYPNITEEPPVGILPENAVRFIRTMSHLKSFYSMYVGYPNGDIMEVVNLRGVGSLHKAFAVPEKARWSVVRVFEGSGERVWRYDFYDTDLHWLGREEVPTTYDARKRPWYLLAKEYDAPVRSAPYLFESLGRKGITYSLMIGKGKAVVAIDFTLEHIERFLRDQIFVPTSKVDMFDRKGNLIASSDDAGETDPLFLGIFKDGAYRKVLTKERKGRRVFAMVIPGPNSFGRDTYLGFSVDAAVMMKPYMRNIYYAFGAALIALILSIPLIILTTLRIVRPIKALMRENEKVKKRRFDEVQPVQTYIIELIELSDSLISMSRSIQEYERSLEDMIDSFVKLIAGAIDAKSPYTGGHCKRVPLIALELAKAASASEDEAFKSFRFEKEEDWKAFEMGAWLHDCGKITTPEFVVDKATKLETIYNRIHEIRTRFEVIWRDVDIAFYERLIKGEDRGILEAWREEERRRLLDDFAFVARCNIGGDFMDEEKKKRLREIAKRTWVRHFSNRLGISENERRLFGNTEEPSPPVTEPLLADRPEHLVPRTHFDEEAYRQKGFKLEVPEYLYNFGELYNLSIERGTLTAEDIFKIREHVIMTIEMLEQLPYPDPLVRIPEYAGTHHEALDGSGYPRRLDGERLSIPSRIMAIADIFEALTASDRPYKKGKTLSEALKIMGFMVRDGHLDAALFALFIRSGIYRTYAENNLTSEQIDAIDEEELLKDLTSF